MDLKEKVKLLLEISEKRKAEYKGVARKMYKSDMAEPFNKGDPYQTKTKSNYDSNRKQTVASNPKILFQVKSLYDKYAKDIPWETIDSLKSKDRFTAFTNLMPRKYDTDTLNKNEREFDTKSINQYYKIASNWKKLQETKIVIDPRSGNKEYLVIVSIRNPDDLSKLREYGIEKNSFFKVLFNAIKKNDKSILEKNFFRFIDSIKVIETKRYNKSDYRNPSNMKWIYGNSNSQNRAGFTFSKSQSNQVCKPGQTDFCVAKNDSSYEFYKEGVLLIWLEDGRHFGIYLDESGNLVIVDKKNNPSGSISIQNLKKELSNTKEGKEIADKLPTNKEEFIAMSGVKKVEKESFLAHFGRLANTLRNNFGTNLKLAASRVGRERVVFENWDIRTLRYLNNNIDKSFSEKANYVFEPKRNASEDEIELLKKISEKLKGKIKVGHQGDFKILSKEDEVDRKTHFSLFSEYSKEEFSKLGKFPPIVEVLLNRDDFVNLMKDKKGNLVENLKSINDRYFVFNILNNTFLEEDVVSLIKKLTKEVGIKNFKIKTSYSRFSNDLSSVIYKQGSFKETMKESFKEKVKLLLESGPQRKLYRYVNTYEIKHILESGTLRSGKYFDISLTGRLEIPTTRNPNLKYIDIKKLSNYAGIFKLIIQWDVLNDKVRNLGLSKIAEYPNNYKDEIYNLFINEEDPTPQSKKQFEFFFNNLQKRFPSKGSFSIKEFENYVLKELRNYLGNDFDTNIVGAMYDAYKDYLKTIITRETEERIVRKNTPAMGSFEARTFRKESKKIQDENSIPISPSWLKIEILKEFDKIPKEEMRLLKEISPLIKNNEQYFIKNDAYSRLI